MSTRGEMPEGQPIQVDSAPETRIQTQPSPTTPECRITVRGTAASPLEPMVGYRLVDGREGFVHLSRFADRGPGELDAEPFVQLRSHPAESTLAEFAINRLERIEKIVLVLTDPTALTWGGPVTELDLHLEVEGLAGPGSRQTFEWHRQERYGPFVILATILREASGLQLRAENRLVDGIRLSTLMPGQRTFTIASRFRLSPGDDPILIAARDEGEILIDLEISSIRNGEGSALDLPQESFWQRLTQHPRRFTPDLGCLFELHDGRRGAIQAINRGVLKRGALDRPPYIQLFGGSGRDRSDDGQGVRINLRGLVAIRRVIPFLYIAQGDLYWNEHELRVSISASGNPRIHLAVGPSDCQDALCRLATLDHLGHNVVRVTAEHTFHPDQEALDQVLGWNLPWATVG